MEVSPGYKQTEIGTVPEDWNVRYLGDLIVIKSGLAFSSSHFSDVGPILLTPGNFKLDGGLYFNDRNTKRYSGAYPTSMVFNYGDLLVVMTDLTPECSLLGKPAFVNLHEPILHNQRIGRIVLINKEVSSNFLYRYFLSSMYAHRMRETATGSTVRHTSSHSIYGSQISLPPSKTEQEAIAEALNDLDTLIDSLEKLLEKKRHVKQGTMQELFTGKRRLPEFSGEWVVTQLGKIATIKTGGRNNQDKVQDGDYPFFVRSAIVERINSYCHNCEAILVPGEGGIGSIFHYINGRFDVHQRVYAITDFSSAVSGRFIYYYMTQTFGVHAMQNSVKATVDSLRLPTFQNFEISMPPTAQEQTAIATILNDVDVEITALESRLSKAHQVKQGMMQDLLTGRIRLR